MKFEVYIFGVTIFQMEPKTKFWKIWPWTFKFTYAQVYSITVRELQRNVIKYHWAFNMLWKWDISIIIIWLQSRRPQMFSKNSGLKVAQINCIRMDIVFCVPQQLLMERTNFHLGPNSFYREKMLYSVVYRTYWLTLLHTIWSVLWFWACHRWS